MTTQDIGRTGGTAWHVVIVDEGFRLFFPLAALYAAFAPFLWLVVWQMQLPSPPGCRPRSGTGPR